MGRQSAWVIGGLLALSLATAPPGGPALARDTDAAPTAVSGAWGTVLQGAARAYYYLQACEKNLDQKRECFDFNQDQGFTTIRQDIADLSAEIERNRVKTNAALNAVIQEIRDQEVKAAFRAVESQITHINIAALKYQQYNDCLAHINRPAVPCKLSDINGNPVSAPQYENPTSVSDLYRDLDKGVHGGPVARFLYATLKTFNKTPDDLEGGLRNAGLDLQHGIAGSRGRVQTGLLYALFQSLNASEMSAQGGNPGSRPAFVTSAYLTKMNDYTQYFVDLEAAYFTTVVAAVQIQDRHTQLTGTAEALTNQATLGVYKEPNLALGQQSADFTFPLTRAPKSNQAWFMPGNGKVYRTQREDYSSTMANYDFGFPSFSTLSLLSSALMDTGVKISRLQRLYPDVLPAGDQAAWWATFGEEIKQFQTKTHTGDEEYPKYTNRNHFSGSQAPDYGIWGDNVAQKYDYDCVIPVRMWDNKPSPDAVWDKDFAAKWIRFYNFDWEKTYFEAVKRGDGNTYFKLEPGSKRTYDTVVQNGAVPAYDLSVGYGLKHTAAFARPIRQGVGTFYRCAGWRDEQYTNPITGYYMWIVPYRTDGLFERLSGQLTQFDTCKALRRADWRGIGRPGAQDVVAGKAARRRASYTEGNTLFRRDTRWYRRNKALDKDGDGIACEITQGRTFPRP